MEIEKRDTPLPMISETDEDLLVIMSMKDDESACNSAFSEFHRRYKDLLYYMVGGVCSSHPNSRELTKVIFNNVMLNVYQYCHSFTCEGQTDPEKVKKSILGWLATIARNEYKAQFKKLEKRDAERSAFKTMVKSSCITFWNVRWSHYMHQTMCLCGFQLLGFVAKTIFTD